MSGNAWKDRYDGLNYEYKSLQQRVRQGALFEQQYSEDPFVCPECGTDMLTLDVVELALCPECHDLHSFSICPTKSIYNQGSGAP